MADVVRIEEPKASPVLDITDELRGKLRNAKADEVESILAEAGVEIAGEVLERIKSEINRAAEHDGEDLSLDELDAVSGGGWIRRYDEYGCAATVEYNSDCWGQDGGCALVHNTYYYGPVNVQCHCGRWMFKKWLVENPDGSLTGILSCPYCNDQIEIDERVWDILVPSK